MPITDTQQQFVSRYLGVRMDKGNAQAAFEARLAALLPGLRSALAGPAPDPALKAMATTLGALRRNGDLAAGLALMDRIDAALAPATGPAPDAPDDAAGGWTGAHQAWLDANDRLDAQLNALRQAILGETGHPEYADALQDIARVGLNALTGNHRVRLMAAFQVIGPGDGASLARHGDKALAAIAAFRAYLDASEKVDACEGNPWDVDVAIRDTLYPALDRLGKVLQARPQAA